MIKRLLGGAAALLLSLAAFGALASPAGAANCTTVTTHVQVVVGYEQVQVGIDSRTGEPIYEMQAVYATQPQTTTVCEPDPCEYEYAVIQTYPVGVSAQNAGGLAFHGLVLTARGC